MKLNRRSFLKGVAGSIVMAGIPVAYAFPSTQELEINPKNLLNHVEVTKRALKLKEDNLDLLTCSLVIYLAKESKVTNSQLENLDLYLGKLSTERLFHFYTCADPFDRGSIDFHNISEIHVRLFHLHQKYKSNYEKCVSSSCDKYYFTQKRLKPLQEKGEAMIRKYYPSGNYHRRFVNL